MAQNPLCSAGDPGSAPGLGRFPPAMEHLSPGTATGEPTCGNYGSPHTWSPSSPTTEAPTKEARTPGARPPRQQRPPQKKPVHLEPVLPDNRGPHKRSPPTTTRAYPLLTAARESPCAPTKAYHSQKIMYTYLKSPACPTLVSFLQSAGYKAGVMLEPPSGTVL